MIRRKDDRKTRDLIFFHCFSLFYSPSWIGASSRSEYFLMDEGVKDANGCLKKPLSLVGSEKVEDRENGEEDNNSESNSLLPSRRGGLSRKSDKSKRKVQWNDNNGNKLAEVLVFDPSDVSDSDEEDSDSDSCICSIM